MEENPLVSICMPAYNAAKYIEETISSVVDQSYPNWELIIVDDGSTDNTIEVVKNKFESDSRIRVYSQKNAGAGAARNKAYHFSKGSLIKFLDADDLLNVTALESQVFFALIAPTSIISGKWARFYSSKDEIVEPVPEKHLWRTLSGIDWITESLKDGPNMTQPGIFLIPRSLIEKSGLWLEELSTGPCDDMEFFTRLMLNSTNVTFSKNSILYYRSGLNGSLSTVRSRKSIEAYFKTIELTIELIFKTDQTEKSKVAIGNLLQNFIFNIFPHHFDLEKKAKELKQKYGATATMLPPLGKITSILSLFLGWKTAKTIRGFINLSLFSTINHK